MESNVGFKLSVLCERIEAEEVDSAGDIFTHESQKNLA